MRTKTLLLCISLYVLLTSASMASTIHVPGDYPTIQGGINAAVNGDTVLVASGTYQEHLDYHGKAIVVISAEGPEATIIERQYVGISLVTFSNGESAEAKLIGFTIQNSYDAAAVFIDNAQPQILDNRFMYNLNSWLGGAISAKNFSNPTIQGNLFWGNSAFRGGAIDIGELAPSDAKIERNTFFGNTSQTHGGAVFIRNSSASFINHNIFYMNHALGMGAAACLSECNNTAFFNNTVAFNINFETWNGSGLVIWYTNNCSIYNNIFAYNVGIALRQEPYYSSSASYNAMWGNTANYVNITPGDGSITSDPLFGAGTPYSFELSEGSPCIDAGDPSSPPDPDGSIADMGALYFGGITAIDNPLELPTMTKLLQNYPNPFNAGTQISFSISEDSDVEIDIFDTMGRKVRTLINGYYEAGNHQVNWNGLSDNNERISSGVYFYLLRTNSFESTKKMILLK